MQLYKKIITISSFITISIANLTLEKRYDFARIEKGIVSKVITPTNKEELCNAVRTTQGRIAIAGGKFSMGGHTWINGGTVIDMHRYNRVLAFDKENKTITVETGITWNDLQEYIAPFGLAVKVMQSYNDFSIGGSLSVNVHGRALGYGPLIETIKSIGLLFADGSEIIASRTENSKLFYGALGGYGSLGIITHASLSLTDNSPIEQEKNRIVPLHSYTQLFYDSILANPQAVFHNANLSTVSFDHVCMITFIKSERAVTIPDQLMPLKATYFKEACAFKLCADFPGGKHLRDLFESFFVTSSDCVWRNYEMSYKVASLEHTKKEVTTQILQEYFVPITQLEPFVQKLKCLTQKHGVNLLNVSIRHVPADKESLMAYARQESFALVMFITMENNQRSYARLESYTRELINAALSLNGTYYLPYVPFARVDQFKKAYPAYKELQKLKKEYDPENRFSNTFLNYYLT